MAVRFCAVAFLAPSDRIAFAIIYLVSIALVGSLLRVGDLERLLEPLRGNVELEEVLLLDAR
jgi:uncharacterized MAPEG superfamily protein